MVPAVGEFNVIVTHFDPKAGYVGVLHGSSYDQVVRVTGGCPNTHIVQTCSQSVDPTSPYYADQTKMSSAKQWMRWPFCPGQIARDPGAEAHADRRGLSPAATPRRAESLSRR